MASTLDSPSVDDGAASDQHDEQAVNQPVSDDDDGDSSSDSDVNLAVKPIRSKPMTSPPPLSSSKKRPMSKDSGNNGNGELGNHEVRNEYKKLRKSEGCSGDLDGMDALFPTLLSVTTRLASEPENGAATRRKVFTWALEMMSPENKRAWEEELRGHVIAELEICKRRLTLEGELVAELEDVLRNVEGS